MDLLEKPFNEGMQADVAAHVMVVTAVDLWRANYGDERVAQALKRAIDRRLEMPTEYWGGTKGAPYQDRRNLPRTRPAGRSAEAMGRAETQAVPRAHRLDLGRAGIRPSQRPLP